MRMYRKKGTQPMQSWNPDIHMQGVSISEADLKAGSPKLGDMIAENPSDPNDRWLVARSYFLENYESV